MTTVLQLLLGSVTCGFFIVLARRFGVRREARIYALGLVVVAIIYLGFALGGGGPRWQILQLVAMAVFTLFAWLGVRLSTFFLGAGWALHAGWDGLMHAIPGTSFVPSWYPMACLAFDLVLAGYVLLCLQGKREIPVSRT